MKRKITLRQLFLMLIIMSMIPSLCACSSQEHASRTVKIEALWIRYTLEEAIAEASTIVHGTVTSKSETQVHEASVSDGSIHKEYYRNVSINVTEVFKGDSSSDSVVYKELCGIHEGVEYRYTGFDLVEEGDEVLLFLNDDNVFISPAGLRIVDEDGSISVSSDWLPVTPGQTRSSSPSYTTTPIEDYCGIIRDYLAG